MMYWWHSTSISQIKNIFCPPNFRSESIFPSTCGYATSPVHNTYVYIYIYIYIYIYVCVCVCVCVCSISDNDHSFIIKIANYIYIVYYFYYQRELSIVEKALYILHYIVQSETDCATIADWISVALHFD